MPNAAQSTRIVEVERQILRALVASEIESSEQAELERRLRAYPWHEPDHTVIYQAIVRGRSRGQKNWREQLVAQATRMGFPDLDWKAFLETKPVVAPKTKLNLLLQELEILARES
jgi:hypothetical protein